jgi:hypothetical protein
MRIIGCDLHARQQTLAMLDGTTGEVVKATLKHEGNLVREFYDKLPRPVRVGIEATGSNSGVPCDAAHRIVLNRYAGSSTWVVLHVQYKTDISARGR